MILIPEKHKIIPGGQDSKNITPGKLMAVKRIKKTF
jgi:hypothetical protein